jgi:hypothetical protein
MRFAKAAFVLAAALGSFINSNAYACDASGYVVCSTDPSVPLSGVDAIFTSQSDGMLVTDSTDENGRFDVHLNLNTTYDSNQLSDSIQCTLSSLTMDLGTIQVDDPQRCPGIVSCPVSNTDGFPKCFDRPLGNPRAECAYFGLSVLDKDDGLGGLSTRATTSARLARIKTGTCYAIAMDVNAGDTLESPFGQGISHVTYCGCPE